jgi:hypothetical protein
VNAAKASEVASTHAGVPGTHCGGVANSVGSPYSPAAAPTSWFRLSCSSSPAGVAPGRRSMTMSTWG